MDFTQTIIGPLQAGIDNVGAAAYNYALVMAAVGTLVMAMQESIKEIFRLRFFFNRRAVARWMNRHSQVLLEFHELASGSQDSTGGLYDQPVEKMMAQIQAAANIALEYPQVYPAAYQFFTDLSGVQRDGAAADRVSTRDAEWYLVMAREGRLVQWQEMPAELKLQIAQAKSRLSNLVTRKLDMFQNRTQNAWALCNQLASVLGAGLVVFVILMNNNIPLLWKLVWGLFGGLLAPVAKDLVSGLKSFARGR